MPIDYAEGHMRKRLAPILFDEDDLEAARAQRASPVEPAKPLPRPEPRPQAKACRTRRPCTASTPCSSISRPSF